MIILYCEPSSVSLTHMHAALEMGQLLKILTVMIRAYDIHAECCLNWNIYDIGVNREF